MELTEDEEDKEEGNSELEVELMDDEQAKEEELKED